jgi:tetratricopeptide (TPR) repeat protein
VGLEQIAITVGHQDQKMDIETIDRYWQKACELTADLESDSGLTTPRLVDFINKRLPPGIEKITKTKVNYLHANGIVNPQIHGAGSVRKSWRYGKEDVRLVLLVELLKTEKELSVKEIKGWLRSLNDSQLRMASDTPTPESTAYPLLRNRTIGTLLITLGGNAEYTFPPGCMIGLRLLKPPTESWRPGHSVSREEISRVLSDKGWHIAATNRNQKLYVYSSLEQLLETQSEIRDSLPKYQWNAMTLEDIDNNRYSLLLGASEREIYHPLIKAILSKYENPIKDNSIITLRDYPGLTTLLKAIFMTGLRVGKGTLLSTLSEIIARVSDSLDYSAILAPDSEGKLIVKECSSQFPFEFRGQALENSQFLSEWCYTFGQSLVVEPTVEGDPRIPIYGSKRPNAAIAVPAIAKEVKGQNHKIVGVLYAGRSERLPERGQIISHELKAGLEALGHICGDIIAREQLERGTMEEMSRLLIPRPISARTFTDLRSLLQVVNDLVREGVSPENAPRSWVYLLTLNIQSLSSQQDPSQKTITEWVSRQAAEVTKNFLSSQLFKRPMPVGSCEVGPGKFAFAILKIADFAETRYKEGLDNLSKQLRRMGIKRMPIKFYPRHLTFRYEQIRRDFIDQRFDGARLTDHLLKIVTESLESSPNIMRGNDALKASNLVLAISEYEDALRYAPNNYYVYKHLAEAHWLRGDIDRAIEHCRKALSLNPRYASAHCLLADCLSHQGLYGEALAEYEETLMLNGIRPDFLTRYGITLAGMSPSQYEQALDQLKQRRPDLAARKFHPRAHLEAIAKFESALRSSEENVAGSEHETMDRARYHYHKGYAYLQAYLLDRNADLLKKAIEDFNFARRQNPEDLQMMQAYSYAITLDRERQESINKEKLYDRL